MKKYKTVAGYLRSMEQKLHVARVDPGSNAEQAHERQIINSLLPQLGITTTIAENEKPRDGVERIRRLTTNPAHIKALDTCRKWLGRMKIISVSATHIPQVKTADGLVTYLVHGFKRGDHNLHISVLIDAPEFSGRAFELAEEIAGSDYCFHASENCSVPIPDEIKNKLLSSEELYAVVPELDPHRHQRRVAR